MTAYDALQLLRRVTLDGPQLDDVLARLEQTLRAAPFRPTRVREIMSRDVQFIAHDASLGQASARLEELGITGAPVRRDGAVFDAEDAVVDLTGRRGGVGEERAVQRFPGQCRVDHVRLRRQRPELHRAEPVLGHLPAQP